MTARSKKHKLRPIPHSVSFNPTHQSIGPFTSSHQLNPPILAFILPTVSIPSSHLDTRPPCWSQIQYQDSTPIPPAQILPDTLVVDVVSLMIRARPHMEPYPHPGLLSLLWSVLNMMVPLHHPVHYFYYYIPFPLFIPFRLRSPGWTVSLLSGVSVRTMAVLRLVLAGVSDGDDGCRPTTKRRVNKKMTQQPNTRCT
ncbi:hypothetical protein BJ165DRAFT_933946 [Panaeolus papilionaceus]|nr:hypothetical protein BJ165DRAFT_933946 [Panaeolus papilionaceus]